MKIKGIIYIRVSSEDQTKGTSLENQEQLCRAYCFQKGIEVVEVFRDEGESAKDLSLNNRKDFLRALEFCRKNKMDAFVVLRVSRFARNTEDHFAVRKILLNYGTSLHSVTEPIGNKPSEKFIETVLAGAADYENGIRRQQCTDGMSQKINQGIFPWRSPIGYRCLHFKKRDEKKTLPDPPDELIFPIIQRGLREYSQGLFNSQTELRNAFERWGLRTNKSQVERILGKYLKFYSGIIINPWTGKEVRGLHKAMISEADFQNILRIRSGKARLIKRTRENPDFPLKRTVICGYCNRQLTGSSPRGNGGVYSYYHCQNKNCSMFGKGIAKKIIEKEFVEYLETITPKSKFLAIFNATVVDIWKEKGQLFELEAQKQKKQLELLEEKRKRIFDMREDGSYSKEEFQERKDKIDNEITTVKISFSENRIDQLDIESVLAFANNFINNLGRQWFDLSPQIRPKFQKLVLPEGITYQRGKGFGTAKLGYIYEQNQLSAGNSSRLVDPRGIEPRPHPCHGRVIPIYYGP